YELVRLLLSYGAEVNCYFRVISDTVFPTALHEELDDSWIDVHNQAYAAYSQPTTVPFCEFVSVSWLVHLSGRVVRTLLDYVGHVRLCPALRRVL
ncbi:hypothetical protein CRUP_036792, partial [Coryphaenoides rupestris]